MYGLTNTAADQFNEILLSLEKEAKLGKCSACGKNAEIDDEKCASCGGGTKTAKLGKCSSCSNSTKEGMEKCEACGGKSKTAAPMTSGELKAVMGEGPGRVFNEFTKRHKGMSLLEFLTHGKVKPKTKVGEWTGVPEIISGQQGKVTGALHGDSQTGNPSGAVDRILVQKVSLESLNKSLDEIPGEVRTQNPVIKQEGKNLPAITSGGDKAEKVASFQKRIAKLASQGTLRTYGVAQEGEVKLAASPFPPGESAEKKDSKKAPFKMTPKAWKTLAAAVGIPLGVAAIGIAAGRRASKQSFKSSFNFDAGAAAKAGARAGARSAANSARSTARGGAAAEDDVFSRTREWARQAYERARKEADRVRQEADRARQEASARRARHSYNDPFSGASYRKADFRYGAGSSHSTGAGAGQARSNQGSYRPPPPSDKKQEAYDFFRVAPGTPISEVSKIHKKWSLRWHPDRPGGNRDEQAKINEMFDRIKNGSLNGFESWVQKAAAKRPLRTYRYVSR
jgi:hypothetical protein